ncbi:MAG: rod shape-determining protein MreC [Nitrospiraceae bacterium]|nr:rod shape-determining protein MreC [Nitrospiraceae bacterium]
MPRKKTFLFLAVVVFSFVLMTYQSRKGHTLSIDFLSSPLHATQSATQSVIDWAARPFRMIAVRAEENAKLTKRVGELLLEREQYRETAKENSRLRELLSLRERHRDYVTSARVIARGVDNWTQTLLLDKGTADGVAKDMAAVTPKGLAGKISAVSRSYSRLLLPTDVNFSVSVRLQDGRTEGVLSGTGSRICALKYIPFDSKVRTGDIVITSGLDMLFPAGIPVGYVSAVDNQKGEGNFQRIEVRPFQESSEMEEAIIVK